MTFSLERIEAAAQRYSVKKVFLEISQNSQENKIYRTPPVAASEGSYAKIVSCFCHYYY